MSYSTNRPNLIVYFNCLYFLRYWEYVYCNCLFPKLWRHNFLRQDKKVIILKAKKDFNPLSANITKWSNTLKQFVGNLATDYLSMFDHFVGENKKYFSIVWACLTILKWNKKYFSSFFKVQSCKLCKNKYIASAQITNTEIFTFIAVIVFKLL